MNKGQYVTVIVKGVPAKEAKSILDSILVGHEKELV